VVGIVIVSHSAALAEAVVELAAQMGGGAVRIEAAGGMADPPGAIGTDIQLVSDAIARAAGDDGVLVLMDLGSAVMTAEMAAEMSADADTRVLLCEAPLVEGAVAAAARAGAGAPLEEVAAEARSALRMKSAQLGVEDGAAPAPPPQAPATAGEEQELRLPLRIPLGLHARPAARVVAAAAGFDAHVTVTDATSGDGPADARSLTALVTLGARQGHMLVARASGPQAAEALAALAALAEEDFGDDPTAAAPGAPPAPAPATDPAEAGPPAAVEPPPPGARLRGVPAGPGLAIGPARRLRSPQRAVAIPEEAVGDPADERARLDDVRAEARRDIEQARARLVARAGEAQAAIFDAHLLLLDDAVLLDPAHRAIEHGQGAAQAWAAAVASAAGAYRALDDAYLRERAADVEDVGDRVLRGLTGMAAPEVAREPGILVLDDLAPSAAAALEPELVQGLAIAHGGATSHAAILARALGIAAVVGLGDAVLGIADGTPLVLDGDAGLVEVDLPPDALAARERDRSAAVRRRRRARERAHEPARTRDGATIEVAANIGAVGEAAEAVALGAEGVGLLRTEFLFLDRDEAPDEAEQRAVYEEIAAALEGRPLIVRTLDAGADKPLRFLPQAPEDNPFLGVRGIRLGLARPELLRTQLRAIAGLAGRFDVRVMFPMVATLAEYRAARERLDAARRDLDAPAIPTGIMVEVPAVAVAAERFAREVDFFSIGTNDLAQYAMAADRGNPQLAELLTGPLPPLLRLVAQVVEGAKAHDRWVGVCGELAGDPGAALLLAGLGVDELSMAAPLIPEVKAVLRAVTLTDARDVARRALDLDDAESVRGVVAPLLAAEQQDG
jgi:phosphocarrier protein FPr